MDNSNMQLGWLVEKFNIFRKDFIQFIDASLLLMKTCTIFLFDNAHGYFTTIYKYFDFFLAAQEQCDFHAYKEEKIRMFSYTITTSG